MRHRVPDRRDRTRLGEPWLATLVQEREALGAQGIAREKNHPLAQRGVVTSQDGIERWPVEVGHLQVTHDDIIGPLLEEGVSMLHVCFRTETLPLKPEASGWSDIA